GPLEPPQAACPFPARPDVIFAGLIGGFGKGSPNAATGPASKPSENVSATCCARAVSDGFPACEGNHARKRPAVRAAIATKIAIGAKIEPKVKVPLTVSHSAAKMMPPSPTIVRL